MPNVINGTMLNMSKVTENGRAVITTSRNLKIHNLINQLGLAALKFYTGVKIPALSLDDAHFFVSCSLIGRFKFKPRPLPAALN